jgi:aspartate 1-decarboxylase
MREKDMFIQVLRAKLHNAVVTGANLHYVGSITIDRDLLDPVGMVPGEKVLVVDIDNGNRFETYIIEGERGSGAIQLNGAAARLVNVGDQVIIMAFALVEHPPEDLPAPKIAVLNEKNTIAQWIST